MGIPGLHGLADSKSAAEYQDGSKRGLGSRTSRFSLLEASIPYSFLTKYVVATARLRPPHYPIDNKHKKSYCMCMHMGSILLYLENEYRQ